jgi:4-amino-4-deoxy-L-arabinose transferase-like glycosyltransferase
MVTSKSTSHLLLSFILVSYFILGTLYALETPKWQAPDEPAHFNYIEYVATEKSLPVLQIGDYPHEYLEQIKAARFPPHMSIARIRYESHQPPLYYVLGAILYRLTSSLGLSGQVLILRLFSVVLGTMTLWVIYCVVRDIFPADVAKVGELADAEFLALAAAAFAAVVPMHIAMTAAINNDTLAELLLLLILWQSIHAIQKGLDTRRAIITATLLGLALWTKTTIYVAAVGMVVMSVLLQAESQSDHPNATTLTKARYLLAVGALALLLAIPWFVRNAMVYGNLDILAWRRHDMVVAGQLRTADLLARIGPIQFVKQFVLTTFRSFWAQFGWMGVPVDSRIYQALALLCGVLGLGFLSFIRRVWRGQVKLTAWQVRVLVFLGASALLSGLTYLAYNIKFVQHQGRYLFSALGPLALGAALGLQEILQRRTARLLTVALLVVTLLWLIQGTLSGEMHRWGLALLVAGIAFLASAGWLPTRWQWVAPACLFAAFLALNPILVYNYIVPALRIAGVSQ